MRLSWHMRRTVCRRALLRRSKFVFMMFLSKILGVNCVFKT